MDDPDPADSIFSLPFTASLGPVGPLLRQLRSLTTPPEGASRREVRNLTKDLDVLCSSLMAHSQAEEPSSRVKSWMSEIRELCYDTKNYLDDAPFILKQDDYAQLTPKDKKKIARLKFKTLKSRANHARKRRKRYQIDPQSISNAKFLSLGPRRLPVLHPELIDRGRMDILANMLGTAEEKPLKVVSLVGLEGVGKTTLAKRIYHQTGQQFQCGAFVKVSPKPDMRMLLTSIFTQIQLPGFSEGVSEPACSLDAQDLITNIRQYLQDKRYLIIMDDLWSISVWDIITRAFPDDSHGSRIITTTQLEDVASACCSYQSKYIYQIKPLKVEQSKKLFSGMVFGSEDQGGCSEDFVSVSDVIISKCGRLPLLLANIASLLPTLSPREINLQQWEVIRDSLPSTLRRNPSSEGIKEVLNLIYNKLSPELKTCLLYLAMYPEGYTIKKDDLVKQWVSEGFTGEGQHKEEIARNYFDELVRRGMIQAADIDYRGVLSCTLHRKVHELIVRKSMEGNFIIGVENFQSSIWLPHKVRRLSIQFGGARSARIPAGITLSEVRSLSYFGFYGCTDFIEKCKLLQQITLHVWADATYDLSGISKLLPLRYLKIACNTAVKLPDEIQALQYLETLEVDATVQAIPLGIGGLSRLSSLNIAVRVLTRQDICILQAVPALAALSLHVSAEPAEMIIFDKGGFSLLEYLKFRSSVPLLRFETGSMPGLRNLNLCFNAHKAEQRRIVPIGIEHLSSLREITANIWGADTDVGSAFKTAINNHPSNPRIDVQLVDRIFHGEDMKKQPAGRMPTLLGSSSCVPVPDCHADEQNLPGELYNREIVESLEAPYLFATQMEKQQLAIGHKGQDVEIAMEVEPSSLDPPQLPATASPATSGTIQPQAGKVQDGEITMNVELASLGTAPPPAAVTPEKGTIRAVDDMAVVDIAWLQPPPRAGIKSFCKLGEVVTGAISSLLPKLGNLLMEEYKLKKGVRGEIMFFKAELETMEAALLKISEAPIDQPPDSQVNLWARDVRDLSYELEDSIDKFIVHLHDDPTKAQSFMGFIDRWLSLLTKAKIRHKISMEFKDIKRCIHEVSERGGRYKVDNIVTKPVGPTVDSLCLSALYTKATELIGTDEKSQDLIRELMGADDESEKQTKIVSVVGFGGLGKTTLANVVYQKLRENFECAAFVSVSHNPNMEKIFKDLLHQLGKDFYYITDEDQLIKEIREHLETKRYIIVIDDIWKTSVWKRIKHALIENEYGSRIITTTRIFDVAEQAGVVYKLSPFSSDESRQLFNQRIFGDEDKCPPNQLHDISEEILKKCGGVPLAIITIASMLASKKEKEYTHQYWSLVYRSMGSGLENSSDDLRDMMRILSVSYYDLPPHLKTCLLYMSLYPEDYEIKIKEVVWRWVGEGFIREEQGKSLYEVGEEYFHELINKGLIQPLGIDVDNKAKSCGIHDMVLDLITFLSNEENFLKPIGDYQPVLTPLKIRRLSFHKSEKEDVRQPSNMSLSHLRSVIVFNQAFSPSLEIMGSFPVLRVLDLSDCKQITNKHCKDICSLFHLRYLRLQGTSITEIPKEIGNLRILQVLDISETELVKQLPSTFSRLTKLMLLDMLNSILCEVPRWMSSLLSLSSLSITVGTLQDEYIQVLGSMPSLSELSIQVEKPTQGRNQRLVIDGASPFLCLRSFTIRSRHSEMDLSFSHGAMQKVQKLELLLGAFKTTEFVVFDFGIENLSSLEYVSNGMIYYDEQRQQALDSAIQRALDKNPSKPKMIRPKIEIIFRLDISSGEVSMRAMKVAAACTGIESVTVANEDKNLFLVIGHINWTDVIQKLRKVCATQMVEARVVR